MKTADGRKRTRLLRHEAGMEEERWDRLAEEAPLAITLQFEDRRARRVVEEALAVTMRTPGDDADLALGLAVAEGVISAQEAPEVHCVVEDGAGGPRLVLELPCAPRRPLRQRQRGLYANSSCGVCGKDALDALRLPLPPPLDPLSPEVTAAALRRLPEALRRHQHNFAETGGLHACALFTPAGELEAVFEDVGRHNALDKLIGQAARTGRWPLRKSVLLLSGRVSFELMQKAAVAEVAVIAAIGAPSSLAVELAQHFGQTLVGFLRADRFNTYSHPQRIQFS
ncbi:MAG: formate dehydrogenase accessory sulfurtransferase FdhD [Opitutales bacterium]